VTTPIAISVTKQERPMPRRPLGEKAMTNAERQQKRRERLRQAQPPKAAPKAKATTPSPPTDEVAALKKRIADLEAEVARLGSPLAEPQKQQQVHAAQTESAPKQQTIDREAMAARMRANAEAHDRERAQWGGRPKSLVIDDIGRLIGSRGVRLDDDVRETIINAMLPHVRDQAYIDKGISRRTYRKVLADLHTDRNSAGATAFVAFKTLDVRKDGKRAWRTIVIADDKVRTMADLQRKREEKSERARAAAAKRKASASKP
jgi:hypothetical protein